MKNLVFTLPFAKITKLRSLQTSLRPQLSSKCKLQSPYQQRYPHTPADGSYFQSIVDNPPVLVRSGQRHGPGLLALVLIPVLAFGLGTWQVFRLHWKTDLIAKFEDRILKPPLPLPPRIDPAAIKDFDYRRIVTTGILRHDKEMLIGPRVHDGNDGYLVVTPLQREENASTILVNRGWISKKFKRQVDRQRGLPVGLVTVEGLLREPWKKNMFTPNNKPELGEFYFPDVEQMAKFTGSDSVWVEETMVPDLLKAYDREAVGNPIGRPAAVNLRNNHTQYIFTWYALSAATAIMFWMVVKKPPPDSVRRVRQNKEW